MEETVRATKIDRELVALADEGFDRFENPLVFIPAVASASLGLGTGEGIHRIIFPKHVQYDQTQNSIENSQYDIGSLRESEQLLGTSLTKHERTLHAQKITQLRAEIKHSRSMLPHGYNGTVDTAASIGGGFTVGGLAFAVLYIATRKRVRTARTRIASSQRF